MGFVEKVRVGRGRDRGGLIWWFVLRLKECVVFLNEKRLIHNICLLYISY